MEDVRAREQHCSRSGQRPAGASVCNAGGARARSVRRRCGRLAEAFPPHLAAARRLRSRIYRWGTWPAGLPWRGWPRTQPATRRHSASAAAAPPARGAAPASARPGGVTRAVGAGVAAGAPCGGEGRAWGRPGSAARARLAARQQSARPTAAAGCCFRRRRRHRHARRVSGRRGAWLMLHPTSEKRRRNGGRRLHVRRELQTPSSVQQVLEARSRPLQHEQRPAQRSSAPHGAPHQALRRKRRPPKPCFTPSEGCLLPAACAADRPAARPAGATACASLPQLPLLPSPWPQIPSKLSAPLAQERRRPLCF